MISLDEARAFYNGAESGHDFDHILRVLALAERLAVEEGADLDIIRAAVLLHDVARFEEDHSGDGSIDHAEQAAQHARNLLLNRGANAEFAERVADAISSHRFRGEKRPTTLEAKILFDADKLDALGATGIARSYAIAGATNQRLYSEPEPDGIATKYQLHSENHTPVAEFSVKLSKLRDLMHTATAKRLAAQRHDFMVEFFERLRAEVEGKI